ncbi:MAG: class II aldolase/adducin family protein [Bacteroidales bacterium]|nr:class II aldolase/adducin family protein [Bacteroidales bacterium]
MIIPEKLISLSGYYGSNKAYVIAGGGNTSYKKGDSLWIKASGIPLAGIDESGFVCLSRMKLAEISSSDYSTDPFLREEEIKKDLLDAIKGDSNKRPSVETSLHNLINFPYVVHTHPTSVNALLCSVDAKMLTKKLFGNEVLFVDYTNPGYELFKQTEEQLVEYISACGSEPGVIFLGNHGMIVSGADPEDIHFESERILKTVEAQFKRKLPSTGDLQHHELYAAVVGELDDYFQSLKLFSLYRNNDLIRSFVDSKENFKKTVRPFTPDNVVYCKSKYLYSSARTGKVIADFESFKLKYGYFPRIIALEKDGLIALGPDEKSAASAMEVFQDMLKISFLSGNFNGPRFLSDEQIHFIDTWEAENYRRSIKS